MHNESVVTKNGFLLVRFGKRVWGLGFGFSVEGLGFQV